MGPGPSGFGDTDPLRGREPDDGRSGRREVDAGEGGAGGGVRLPPEPGTRSTGCVVEDRGGAEEAGPGTGCSSPGRTSSPRPLARASRARSRKLRNSPASWKRSDGRLASALSNIWRTTAGKSGDGLVGGRGLRLHDLVEHGVQRLRVERLLAREHLVEDAAQGEDVGARVHVLAPHLLGRHVVRGPHHQARARHVRPAETREPEVHDLHLPAGKDVQVGGLEVAVEDAVGVCEGQPFADLLDDVHLLVEGLEPPFGHGLLEVHPLEQLHGDVELVLLLAEIVDGDDVGVIQQGCGLRLAAEALPERLVLADLGGDGLDRHEAA